MAYSSYATNNYAEVFKAIISAACPRNCVELGVLEGYSTIAIAEALDRNRKIGGGEGHLEAYDLFEDYPYRNAHMDMVRQNIRDVGLTGLVTLTKMDAFKVHEQYQPRGVDFLHVDLSNTGDTVRRIMELWNPLMAMGGLICFEGGSEERDEVEWMKTYKAPSIKQELDTNKIIEENYVFATYFKFPSLTVLLKKR